MERDEHLLQQQEQLFRIHNVPREMVVEMLALERQHAGSLKRRGLKEDLRRILLKYAECTEARS